MLQPCYCSPRPLGPFNLRKPFVFLPFATGYADERGKVTPGMLRHYERMAASGVGLVVVEAAVLRGSFSPWFFQACAEDHLPGLGCLVDAIHEQGALASLQICHPGRFSVNSSRFAPSAVPPFGNPDLMPEVLDEAQMRLIIDEFVESAHIAKWAGFDAVELHGGTGYLLASFISPHTNRRTDAYGGSLEKRLRFPLEVCRAVHDRVGGFPVAYRIMVREYIEGGLNLEEGVEAAARIAEALSPPYLSVTAGMYECFAIQERRGEQAPAGYMLPEAEAVKKRLPGTPVIAAGQLYTPQVCEKAFAAGIDAVGLGRPLFADLDLVRKLCGQNDEPVRVCKQCHYCVNCIRKGKPVSCAVWSQTEREVRLQGVGRSQ